MPSKISVGYQHTKTTSASYFNQQPATGPKRKKRVVRNPWLNKDQLPHFLKATESFKMMSVRQSTAASTTMQNLQSVQMLGASPSMRQSVSAMGVHPPPLTASSAKQDYLSPKKKTVPVKPLLRTESRASRRSNAYLDQFKPRASSPSISPPRVPSLFTLERARRRA